MEEWLIISALLVYCGLMARVAFFFFTFLVILSAMLLGIGCFNGFQVHFAYRTGAGLVVEFALFAVHRALVLYVYTFGCGCGQFGCRRIVLASREVQSGKKDKAEK